MTARAMPVLVLAALLAGGCGGDGETSDGDGDSTETPDTPQDPPADDAADGPTEGDVIDMPVDDAPADAPDLDAEDDDGPPPALEDIHYSGRFDWSNPSEPRFEWSGTSIAASFDGTGVSVVLDAWSQNFFEVIVDGAPSSVIEVSSGEAAYPLASGLAAGEHTVEIFRRTEAWMNPVTFKGFVVEGGAIVPSPWPWAHGLEFIGDSITAGYGALGVGPDCPFSAETESAYVSYAGVAARDLDASAHLLAWSGKGVYQNYGGGRDELMPVLYERTIPTEADSAWDFSFHPDAVIINLGTNDFSVEVDQTAFEAAYVDLILQIRGHHPDAAIYCVGGYTLNDTATDYITNAIAASADANVQLLDLPPVDSSEGWGCDWHPSAATHERIGHLVAERLGADLGL
jgi:lysophospholipase L1-like esterase